jgi:sugar (glycoside-pentoside-hexuronide) transporter
MGSPHEAEDGAEAHRPASTLGLREKLGYGFGDWGINFHFSMTTNFLLFFYTDVFGLLPAVAGSVLLVARLSDALTDPLMGVLADRTRTRWGKLRPYLLFGAIPLGIASVLLFSVPSGSGAVKTAYAYATYILYGVCFTVITIPYSALTAAITADSQERTVLSTFRIGFATLGGGIVAVVTPGLVAMFADPATGFQTLMAVYSVLGTAMLWFCFATVSERVKPAEDSQAHPRDILRIFRSAGPLWILMLVFVLGSVSFTLQTGAKLYYFKYNLGREDLWGVFLLSMAIPAFLGIIAAPAIGRRLGKAGGMVACSLVSMASGLGIYFTPYDQLPAIFIWSMIGAVAGSPVGVLTWSIIPDTVEYAEWKSGIRAEGIVYAVAGFFQKASGALGGALSGMILAATGYVAGQVQTETALTGILSTITIVPIAFGAAAVIALMFYRLDSDTHARIVTELEERRRTRGGTE